MIRQRRSIVVAVLVLGVLGGCATNHKLLAPAGSLQKGLGIVSDPTGQSIAAILSQQARPHLPTTLAVVKVGTGYYGGCYYGGTCSDTIGAEELTQWKQAVVDIGTIDDVVVIPGMLLSTKESTLADIRAAAASLDCELVLVYSQQDSEVSNFNNAAALYWTFVGLWLVPGSVIEHRTLMEAALVDCRTGKVLALANGDGHLARIIPAAYAGIQKDKLRQEVPARAFEDLLTGCRKMFEEFDKTWSPASQPSE